MEYVNLKRDDEADAEDLFDALVQAYEEGENVTVTSYDDFDYTYRVLTYNPNKGEAVLQATNERNGGVEFMKVALTSGREHLEAYVLDMEYGSTFIGNVFAIRESRY